jgi:hypothetical protein
MPRVRRRALRKLLSFFSLRLATLILKRFMEIIFGAHKNGRLNNFSVVQCLKSIRKPD